MAQWAPLLLNKKTWLVSFSPKPTGYTLYLTDFTEAWASSLQGSQFKQYKQKILPQLETRTEDVLDILFKQFHPTSQNAGQPEFSLAPQVDAESPLVLSLASKIGFFPFSWSFHCSKLKSPSQFINDKFIFPLFFLEKELSKYILSLVTLLKQKDAEIVEYKKIGIKIPKSLKPTRPFDSAQFFQEATQSANYDMSSGNPQIALSTLSNAIYQNIMQNNIIEYETVSLEHQTLPTEKESENFADSPMPIKKEKSIAFLCTPLKEQLRSVKLEIADQHETQIEIPEAFQPFPFKPAELHQKKEKPKKESTAKDLPKPKKKKTERQEDVYHQAFFGDDEKDPDTPQPSKEKEQREPLDIFWTALDEGPFTLTAIDTPVNENREKKKTSSSCSLSPYRVPQKPKLIRCKSSYHVESADDESSGILESSDVAGSQSAETQDSLSTQSLSAPTAEDLKLQKEIELFKQFGLKHTGLSPPMKKPKPPLKRNKKELNTTKAQKKETPVKEKPKEVNVENPTPVVESAQEVEKRKEIESKLKRQREKQQQEISKEKKRPKFI